nr:uncharacterized protein LOC112000181 [Quercus suber]
MSDVLYRATKYMNAEDALLALEDTQLEGAKGIWEEELPSVLWVNKTMVQTPIGETPFRLAYKSEAVIPAEVGLTSYWVENHDESKHNETMCLQLDPVDKVRATAEQRLAHYQNLMSKHYNSKVKHRDFQVGDLVLRKEMGTTRDASQEMLGPNWEGP